jgi:hypothetical protein
MSNEGHGAEDEHQDDGDLSPLEKLRARHQADNEARRQEWLAEHAGDPDDPFTADEMDAVVGPIDQPICQLSREGEDGTWLRLTYLPRPPVKLIDVTMGNAGSDEPAVSLIISDTEARDLIARIIDAIGPQQPDPPLEPRTDCGTAEETGEPCPRCGYRPGDDLDQT